jgi:hypothetical protein
MIFGLLFAAATVLGTPCTRVSANCAEWVKPTGQQSRVLIYRNYPLEAKNENITRALIFVHGINRDADNHFRTALAAATPWLRTRPTGSHRHGGLDTEKQTGIWRGRPQMRFTREADVAVEVGKVGDGQRSNQLNYVPNLDCWSTCSCRLSCVNTRNHSVTS